MVATIGRPKERVVACFLCLVVLVGGETARSEDDPIDTGCPLVAKEVLELTLHFNGHTGFTLDDRLQTVVRDALAVNLLSVGIPDRRYLGIKSFSDVCYTVPRTEGRRLLHKEACVMLRMAVFVPEPKLVSEVMKVIRGEEYCREAEMALDDSGDLEVTCGLEEVVRITSTTRMNPWGLTAEAVFFLGLFTGTVLAVLLATLVWQFSYRLGLNCFVHAREQLEKRSLQVAEGRPVVHTVTARPSISMLYRRSCGVNAHIPLDDSDILDCPEICCDPNSRSLGEGIMVREVAMSSSHYDPSRVLLLSMFFEEILTKSNAIGVNSPRYAQIKTRILHKKLKVREADVAQDGSNLDPAFLLQLGSKYLLTIEVRKEASNTEPFPFACLDHVVVVAPDGTPQMLPLVTLSSVGGSDMNRPGYTCNHVVAALWDPCEHASQQLAKPTPDGVSLSLDVTVVFRVLGNSGALSYVQKTLKVRFRQRGQTRNFDKPYTRDWSAAKKIPIWAKPFMKGGTVALEAAKQKDSSKYNEESSTLEW